MSKKRDEYYHDKGEQDRSKGEHNPPHGIIDDLTTWSDSGMKRNREDNEAYRKGWENTDGQVKGKR